jgi:hypothetical protein
MIRPISSLPSLRRPSLRAPDTIQQAPAELRPLHFRPPPKLILHTRHAIVVGIYDPSVPDSGSVSAEGEDDEDARLEEEEVSRGLTGHEDIRPNGVIPSSG